MNKLYVSKCNDASFLVPFFILVVAITAAAHVAQLNRESSRNEFGMDSETSGWSFRPHEERKDFVGRIPSTSDKRSGTFSICAKLELRNMYLPKRLRLYREKKKNLNEIYRC